MITRNNPSLLNCCPIPFLPSLSHFPLPFLPSTLLLFPLLFLLLPLRSPPSLRLLAKLFTPLRYSATFEPSKKAFHLPRYLSLIAPQQMISEDAFTPWRLGPPNFLGITAPFCLVVPTLKLTLLALIISSSNVSLSLSLLHISLPSVDQLRALLSADFIASHPHFLEQYPTSPKDLPTILLNSSLESTLLILPGQRILALSSGTGPSPSNLSDQTPPPCSSQSIIRTPYIVLPYLCEPFLSYHGTSRNPLAQIFHLLHIVTSLDL